MHRNPPAAIGATLIATAMLVAACGDRSGKTLDDPVFPLPATTAPAITVPATVPATQLLQPLSLVAPWVDGAAIPDRHTCADVGVSPALTWVNVPVGAVELAVTVIDVDAAGYVHWIAYGIPPVDTGLVEGQAPAVALEWVNSAGATGWSPPCPPAGETHRYVFTVHALNQQLEVADDADAHEVISIIESTTFARSSLAGIAPVGS